jgi:hypothetical protein
VARNKQIIATIGGYMQRRFFSSIDDKNKKISTFFFSIGV